MRFFSVLYSGKENGVTRAREFETTRHVFAPTSEALKIEINRDSKLQTEELTDLKLFSCTEV